MVFRDETPYNLVESYLPDYTGHIPEDHNLNIHSRENPRSHMGHISIQILNTCIWWPNCN
jgi:hypothetical protein